MSNFDKDLKLLCKGTKWNAARGILWRLIDGIHFSHNTYSWLRFNDCEIEVKTAQTDHIMWHSYGIWEPLVKPDSWLILSAFALDGVPLTIKSAPKIHRDDENLAQTVFNVITSETEKLIPNISFDLLIEKALNRQNHYKDGSTLYVCGETLLNLYIQNGEPEKAIKFAKGRAAGNYRFVNHGNMATEYEDYGAFIADRKPEHLEQYASALSSPRIRLKEEDARKFDVRTFPHEIRFPN